ncbi:hypothetical protein N658DRAFT_494934 [Parathielavia hyrcaniae]|uniref:BPL/LPL catalytic domain-containing protein n=1 Tax=Parathielavia hyrcaniae TaxID=113614 RepID=A0AAN6Q8I0_9PEZI|nr:hypothetical protein N658DRAFT_494934 [Parathielavia hyrcaniae]
MAAPCRLRLRHLHLPSIHPHYIPYSLASRVQEHLRRQHLDFKDGSTRDHRPPPPPPPPPTLLSFTPSPIYTLGRRQTAPLTPTEVARLTSPLRVTPPPPPTPSSQQPPISSVNNENEEISRPRPQLLHSPRGGLTTYHGPGQVVLWPVLDLRSPLHRHYSVKCYARLLERTTIATLAAVFRVEAFTTDDPGVWVRRRRRVAQYEEGVEGAKGVEDGVEDEVEGEEVLGEGEKVLAKIAALGVHLRRHVTALGTAVNVAMPVGPEVVDEGVNPWARFVACGLEGRGVTCVAAELGDGGVEEVDERLLQQQLRRKGKEDGGPDGDGFAVGLGSWRERVVAGAWAEELARRIGIEGGVEMVGEEEAVRLMESLVEEGGLEGGDGIEREYLAQMRDLVRGR